MKKFSFFSAIILLIFTTPSFSQNSSNPAITAGEVQDHINFLASDKLEGRLTGTKGADEAAEYIKNDFKQSGLLPLNSSSYYQNYPFIAGLELTKNNSLLIQSGNFKIQPKAEKDFITTPFSGNKTISGELVFAGYGISAPDLNYDDYSGIDVKNKIVIIMRYYPDQVNPHSKFEKYAPYRYKAKIAKEEGAAGVIFVSGFIPKDESDYLMKLRYDGASGIESFPTVQVKREIIDSLFNHLGMNFKDIQEKINTSKIPNSFVIKNTQVKLNTEVKEITKTGKNVIGYLMGNDPKLKNQYIVVGAHYDHLGYGETGSLYRGKEKLIHNGADDNASGTAGLMEIAEKFASVKNQLKRSIIFVSFSGEELGVLGSTYFVDHPPVPIENMSTMINMDMIGRLKPDTSLIVYGTGTSSIWKELLKKDNQKYHFNLTFNDEGYGPSDHSSFYAKKIPVLFFFTGTHPDYHRPSDDADKINSTGEETILKYVYQITSQIDTMSSKPDYINVPRKERGRMAFRVYVGTIPDYAGQVDGLKITGVSEGGPAQKAGLQGGDIIINFGGKKISNIYDYTYALGDFSPGDIVDVVVMRNGEKKTFKVELGAR